MVESPTEIQEEGTYWCYALEELEGRKPTGDEHRTRETYFERHGVTPPQELSEADLPPVDDRPAAEADAVRELDREALDAERTGGKWHVLGSAAFVEDCWPDVVADVDDQTFWGAKAMTATGFDAHPGEAYVLLVYTPNYFERADVERVRERLREAYGVTDDLGYKPNVYSANGIQPDTAGDAGLSEAYRYWE